MFELQSAIIPKPQHIEDKCNKIKIGSNLGLFVNLTTKGEGTLFDTAVSYLNSKLFESCRPCNRDCKYNISLAVNANDVRFTSEKKDESYIIDITPEGANLIGYDNAGAYYAAVSFVRLMFAENNDVFIPGCYIYDYPRFSKRGHFMECRYGSDFMTLSDWKKAIDYLSEMKINNIVLGLYGCWSRQYDGDFAEYQYVPFKKYPELNTPRNIKYYSAKKQQYIVKEDVLPVMYTEDYLGEMIAYAAAKNIIVEPLFNSYGHNTLIPRIHPEISAVDENGNYSGVSLCTNNEKTIEIFTDIYDEIIDRYLTPNGITGFAIGFDEVVPVRGFDKNNIQENRSPFCKCEKCKDKTKEELIVDYVITLAKHLKKKGMKSVYVYHDMLFEAGILNEDLAKRFKDEDIYDVIVIDWWSYASRDNIYDGHRDKVNSIFRSVAKPITGYFHWNMPTQMNEDVYAVTEVADRHDFEGMIAYSSFEYCYDYNYNVYAECAWNPKEKDDSIMLRYAQSTFPENAQGAFEALKLADEFMLGRYIKADNYCEQIFDYYNTSYLRPDLPYPQDYPGKQFRVIRDNEDLYLPYLKAVLENSSKVYEFFNNNIASTAGDIWKLIAYTYKALADEFLTVYNCGKAYLDGDFGPEEFNAELKRLIKQRDKVIALCEDVRIEANQYTHIRNMTIIKQALCDLSEHIQKGLDNGQKPEINIFEFGKYLSETSMYLR